MKAKDIISAQNSIKKLAKQAAAENALKSMVQHKNPVEAQVTTCDIIRHNLFGAGGDGHDHAALAAGFHLRF